MNKYIEKFIYRTMYFVNVNEKVSRALMNF